MALEMAGINAKVIFSGETEDQSNIRSLHTHHFSARFHSLLDSEDCALTIYPDSGWLGW
jgi:hypothetical protein